jgi:hypothetical protein
MDFSTGAKWSVNTSTKFNVSLFLLPRTALSVSICLSGVGFSPNQNKRILKQSCQALVHMDTCYSQCSNSISGMYITILVLCILQYQYYVYFSTSTEYHLVLVVLSTSRNQSSIYGIIRRAAARSPERLHLSLIWQGLEMCNKPFP